MARKLIELGASWRETLIAEIWQRTERAWDPAYDSDARDSIDQALSRACSAMTEEGRVPLANSRFDSSVRIRSILPANVIGRGDFRYKSDRLTEYLRSNPDKDLVPIVCSRTRDGYRVLDGHHRLRAYAAVSAIRMALAVVITVTPGTGLIDVG